MLPTSILRFDIGRPTPRPKEPPLLTISSGIMDHLCLTRHHGCRTAQRASLRIGDCHPPIKAIYALGMHDEDHERREEDFNYMFSDESGNATVRDNLFFSQDLSSLIFPTSLNVTGALNDYIISPTISEPQPAPSLSTVEPWLTQLNQSTVSDLSGQPKSIDKCPSPNHVPLHDLSQSTTSSNHLFPNGMDKTKSLRSSTARASKKRPPTDHWADTTFTKRRNKKARSENANEAEGTRDKKQSQEREELLARNRVAASKSRQKKKEFVAELEERSRELAEQNKVLHVTVATLKNETLDLKDKCLRHMSCECDGIRQYLAHSVMRKSSIIPTAALDQQDWDQQVDEVLRASETSNMYEPSDVTASTTEVTPSLDSSSIPSPRPNPLAPRTMELDRLAGWQVQIELDKSDHSHHP